MSYPINIDIKANDQASGPMNAIIAVMHKGSQATADQINEFKQARASTSLQTRAMSGLVSEIRAGIPIYTMFGRAMQSVGAIGGTLMSMTNTLILSQINLGISAGNVANAQQQLTIATQAYKAALNEFGATDFRTLQAYGQMIAAQNTLRNVTAQNRLVQIQTTMAYTGVGLSIGSLIAQLITAGVAIDAFAIAQGIAAAASDAFAGAMTIVDLVMDANPIILVAAAIVILVALLYKVTDGFKNWTAVVNFFKDIWKALPGPVKEVLDAIYSGFTSFTKDFAKGLGEFATILGQGFKDAFNGVVSIINDFINGIDAVIKGLNLAASVLHLPSLNLIPDIPGLASGGIVTKPTIAMLGESGPEAIVPLGASGGGGSQFNMTIVVQGNIMTERNLMQAIDQHMWVQYSLRRRTS